jgi:hypothetical protein
VPADRENRGGQCRSRKCRAVRCHGLMTWWRAPGWSRRAPRGMVRGIYAV